MIGAGLTFGLEGPMMEGTWYNVNTGDSFTVRNSFFEDNQFIIQTTDGRVLNYEQIQNYVKSDKPMDVEKKQQNHNDLPTEVADLIGYEGDYNIMKDDLNMIQNATNMSLGNLADTQHINNQQVSQTIQPVLPNYNIISKALTKRSLPEFQVGVDWTDCPIKEMNMLIDLMDVSESEIIDWYLSQVDVETTTLMIKEVIKDYLNERLYVPETTEVVELLENSVSELTTKEEKTSKTKTTKKTSKKK